MKRYTGKLGVAGVPAQGAAEAEVVAVVNDAASGRLGEKEVAAWVRERSVPSRAR